MGPVHGWLPGATRSTGIGVLAVALALLGATVAEPAGAGTFSGRLELQAERGNRFIYIPDKDSPFTFVTSNNEVIAPQSMYTNGGSIPPVLWLAPGLSPWTYGPAFVLHDWLFRQHHCHYAGYERVSFEDSARILTEAMDTLEHLGLVPRNPRAVAIITRGAHSRVARVVWDRGFCTPQKFGAGPAKTNPIVKVYDFTATRHLPPAR